MIVPSAFFTYLKMEQVWGLHDRSDKKAGS